jgi:NAD(P)-dependent dehydrogenase (short-subunit alcohol dehydrogenase family)
MPDRLKDKVCIVTGGGAGLGEATSRLFAEEGARVVIADIDQANAERVAGEITRTGGDAIAVVADVAEPEAVKAVIRTTLDYGNRIDVLVNNAAVGGAHYNYTVVDAPLEQWTRCTNVNLRGPFLCMKYALCEMLNHDKGAIVNVGSISSVVGLMTQSIYAPTKAGILQLTRQAAIDYAKNGIRINCVLPGGMDTPMTREEIAATENKELIEKELELLPMGRLAAPREVAYAILFLASDEASFITGTGLTVDGGYTAQ